MFRVNITLLLPGLCAVNPSIPLTFFGHSITGGAHADLLILWLQNPFLSPFLLGYSILFCTHDLHSVFLKVYLCSWLLTYISLQWVKLIKKSRSLHATVLTSLFTILRKSHTLISRGVIFTTESLMQIFNYFMSNTISSAILIKTCPLEAFPVITTSRYVSLPVAKLFILFYGIVQYWTDYHRILSQSSQECIYITCEHAYIFINQARTWLGQTQKRTVFSAHGITHLVWYYSSLLKPFCCFALSWCHRPQPSLAIALAFSEF